VSEIARDVALLLVRELQGIERELHLFPDEGSVWHVVPGVSNSAGNLALHVAGNLRHFVGAVLGGTGYLRNRSDEFARTSVPRTDLAAELRTAVDDILAVVPNLTDESLNRPFPCEFQGSRSLPTHRFLLHLCTHAAYHLGQIGYLRRVLTGEAQPSGALSFDELSD
jgi:uncharacterized damage-inducible protein DinB